MSLSGKSSISPLTQEEVEDFTSTEVVEINGRLYASEDLVTCLNCGDHFFSTSSLDNDGYCYDSCHGSARRAAAELKRSRWDYFSRVL